MVDYDGSLMESDTTSDQLGCGLIRPDIKFDEPMSDQIRYHMEQIGWDVGSGRVGPGQISHRVGSDRIG